jgi:D-tyrosyl-tRNA(Tyr) deacylase
VILMRLVLQRVTSASVTVDGEVTGKIRKGLLVLLGVGVDDTREILEKMADKMLKLRIFADENDKTNLSLTDVNGELLVVSQFTLYADCRKGNRPSFIKAGDPQKADELYEYFKEYCKKTIPIVESGIFGADMKVDLCNDGPFTIVLDSDEIVK